jgi:UDP-N-acetylglucosamine diphosphorylase / glucose-1-phosphate thymidylyltransferase / UDP-N-acetylgalactosamine diphosphorylase / glucosamine-1-phosphate N-acetyltransferase / galactosamine-1-phosphate N-acetyltransferase
MTFAASAFIGILRPARVTASLRPMFTAGDLFDLSETEHGALFEGCTHAWEALARLEQYLKSEIRPRLQNRCDGVAWIGPQVVIGEGTEVEDGVMIKGPAIIGRGCRIRHNAYIREQVIVGDDCVVGNSSELKHSVLFNRAQVPHFNYVGDSILGHRAHLGAGVKISNLKLSAGTVQVEHEGVRIDTGLRKLGALIGDGCDVGCNAVLNPGSILGRGSIVYPNVSWRGVLRAGQIAKNRSVIEVIERVP